MKRLNTLFMIKPIKHRWDEQVRLWEIAAKLKIEPKKWGRRKRLHVTSVIKLEVPRFESVLFLDQAFYAHPKTLYHYTLHFLLSSSNSSLVVNKIWSWYVLNIVFFFRIRSNARCSFVDKSGSVDNMSTQSQWRRKRGWRSSANGN